MTSATVLFVDDDVTLLNTLERSIRRFRADWSAQFVDRADKAVDWLQQNSCDLLVVDYYMPLMNGVELLDHARETWPNVKRVMLTGCSDISVAAAAINTGSVSKFLAKPIDTSSLFEELESLVDSTRPLEGIPLGESAIPMFLVTSSAQLTSASPAGAFYLANESELFRRIGDRLLPMSVPDQTEFLRNLSDASTDERGRVRLMSFVGAEGDRTFVAIRRYRDQCTDKLAVAITEPSKMGRPGVRDLQYGLNLSYTEAILVSGLISGKSVTEAGAGCGLTKESSRTYLKRVYEKVGVSKQGDLIRLVCSTPVGYLRPLSQTGPKSIASSSLADC